MPDYSPGTNEVEFVEIFKALVRIPGHANYDFQEKIKAHCFISLIFIS